MNLERYVAGMKFAHPVMNGPGVNCKSVEEIEAIAKSLSSGVLGGAFTKLARAGNPGETAYFDNPLLSLNSLGMPNPGIPGLEKDLPKMVEIVHAHDKSMIANIAGFSAGEFVELAVFAEECGVDAVQLNLSCPNIHGGNQIFCYSLGETERILMTVMCEVGIPVDVKLPPFIDKYDRDNLLDFLKKNNIRADLSGCKIFKTSYAYAEKMAKLLRDYNIPIVTLCNTLGNVLIYKENGEPAIRTEVGGKEVLVGGLGGPVMKPIVIGFVELFRDILRPEQAITAIGGVQSGQDVIDYEDAGADLVQVTTARGVRGEKAIEQIVTEYISLNQECDGENE